MAQEQRRSWGQHPHLGEVHPGGVGAQEPALDVLLHSLQDAVLVQEVNFMLCGVHVDVHILGADFQTGREKRELPQMVDDGEKIHTGCTWWPRLGDVKMTQRSKLQGQL